MTEQQAQSPIDDLFRETFENLPDTPAESGWDTPSDRVWQNIQTRVTKPNKGLGTQSVILMAVLLVTLAASLYWIFSRAPEKPVDPPVVNPVEQPVAEPTSSSPAPAINQPIADPKPPSSAGTVKDTQGKPINPPRNSTEGNQAKPGNNAAQPLPGSKSTLPPNSTEAEKKKGEGN